jgi:hypothetical protein
MAPEPVVAASSSSARPSLARAVSAWLGGNRLGLVVMALVVGAGAGLGAALNVHDNAAQAATHTRPPRRPVSRALSSPLVLPTIHVSPDTSTPLSRYGSSQPRGTV